jgi:hypothetical protein
VRHWCAHEADEVMLVDRAHQCEELGDAHALVVGNGIRIICQVSVGS